MYCSIVSIRLYSVTLSGFTVSGENCLVKKVSQGIFVAPQWLGSFWELAGLLQDMYMHKYMNIWMCMYMCMGRHEGDMSTRMLCVALRGGVAASKGRPVLSECQNVRVSECQSVECQSVRVSERVWLPVCVVSPPTALSRTHAPSSFFRCLCA